MLTSAVSQPARHGIQSQHGLAALALVAALALSACGGSDDKASAGPAPATVTDMPGSDVKLVTLTKRAHERLGVETTATTGGRKGGPVVPFSAVIYDNEGVTWVYTPQDGKPLSFVRQRVTIDDVRADRARLSSGPAAGTEVVSTGAAMLWGTELGVGAD